VTGTATIELRWVSLQLQVQGDRFALVSELACRHLVGEPAIAQPGPGVIARGCIDEQGKPTITAWTYPWCDPKLLDPHVQRALALLRGEL
jgi:hypothetical protein